MEPLTFKEFCSRGGKARAAKVRAEKRAEADARRAEAKEKAQENK
jgi:hypothetical protein